MERKYEKNKQLSLLIKIKREEKVLAAKLLDDQTAFEKKVYANRRMSDLKRCLKSLHTNRHLPREMFLVEGTNCTKAFDDKDKSELFNEFYTSVFSTCGKLSSEANDYTFKELDFLRLGEETEKILKSLDAKPAVPTTSAIYPEKCLKFGEIGETHLSNLPKQRCLPHAVEKESCYSHPQERGQSEYCTE